ncbi:MAG: four helix bundle protein [Ignavibacteriae bacterium]|nr:four helix bundle protein [Ignavibacteria bacterium]MBI3363903.1 four helix bundle protein [Ignavibacteriota bacterium]
MGNEIKSFEDLEVYKKLVHLHLEVNDLTLKFPKHEMYELGSQLRRSSNSIPANIAAGRNNKHVAIYLEGINRAFGELQETRHHLFVAFKKGYLEKQVYEDCKDRYEECGRMLRGLQQSLQKFKA